MYNLTVAGEHILATSDLQLAEDCYRDMVELRLGSGSDEEIKLTDPSGKTLMVWGSPFTANPEDPEG